MVGITQLVKKMETEFGFPLNPFPFLPHHEMPQLSHLMRQRNGERGGNSEGGRTTEVMGKEPESGRGKVSKADHTITPSSHNLAQEVEQEAEKPNFRVILPVGF